MKLNTCLSRRHLLDDLEGEVTSGGNYAFVFDQLVARRIMNFGGMHGPAKANGSQLLLELQCCTALWQLQLQEVVDFWNLFDIDRNLLLTIDFNPFSWRFKQDKRQLHKFLRRENDQ